MMIAILLVSALLGQEEPDPIKEFMKRVKVETEKFAGRDFHRVHVDEGLLFREFGGVPNVTVLQDEGGGRTLRVEQDGKEVLRLQVPDLGDKPLKLPPVVVKDSVSAKVDSKIKDGHCEVTVDGQRVHSGPGKKVRSNVSAESSSKDGKTTSRRFAEVYVDDKLVYRAGEGRPDADTKRNEPYRPY